MSGTVGAVGAVFNQVGTVASQGATLVNQAGALFGATPLAGLSAGLFGQLQPASWRGKPFVVLGSTVRAGRRRALHEYPFRDGVWAEDLGRKGRLYGFDGFIVGEDVGDRIKAVLEAVEQAGPGELVHPTLGSRQCEVVEFEAADRWDAGQVWQLRFEFLEPMPAGVQLLPAAADSTGDKVAAAAADAQGAADGSFLDQVGAALKSGVADAKAAAAAVAPYVATATRLAGDAAGLVNAVRGVAGPFGRYAGGRGTPLQAAGGALRTAAQVEAAVGGAIRAATAARADVTRAASALSALVDL